MKVLLADDSATSRFVVRRALESLGHDASWPRTAAKPDGNPLRGKRLQGDVVPEGFEVAAEAPGGAFDRALVAAAGAESAVLLEQSSSTAAAKGASCASISAERALMVSSRKSW